MIKYNCGKIYCPSGCARTNSDFRHNKYLKVACKGTYVFNIYFLNALTKRWYINLIKIISPQLFYPHFVVTAYLVHTTRFWNQVRKIMANPFLESRKQNDQNWIGQLLSMLEADQPWLYLRPVCILGRHRLIYIYSSSVTHDPLHSSPLCHLTENQSYSWIIHLVRLSMIGRLKIWPWHSSKHLFWIRFGFFFCRSLVFNFLHVIFFLWKRKNMEHIFIKLLIN